MTGACRAGEQRPLLQHQTPRDVAITIRDTDYDDYEQQQRVHIERVSTTAPTVFRYTSFRTPTTAATAPSLAAVSPTFVYAQQQQQAALLARKYAAYAVDDVVGQKRSRSKVMAVATTGYGSMSLQPALDSDDDDDSTSGGSQRTTAASIRALLCKLDDPRTNKRHAAQQPGSLRADATAAALSNQSETESDSDTSCGSNTASSSSSSSTSSSSSLQPILRIRDGIYACRKVKKHVSVEFQLDANGHREDRDDCDVREAAKRRYGALACASSCMPRRLTMEEKAVLYRIRPDLQLTPMPLILRELEEIRRRRQRKLMFSILGGTLILLMIVVFYYLLTETQ